MWERIARRTLLALSVLLAAFLGYLLVFSTDSAQTSQSIPRETLDQADAKLSEFIFTQSKGDLIQWQVQARQARLFEHDKRAVLRDVALTLYGTEGHEVTVHGDEGTLNTVTKNFELANREAPLTIHTRSGYTIYTNHLIWTEQSKELHTDDAVRIVGHGLEVKGHGLRGRMEAEEFEILQDVQVDLSPAS